MIETMAGTELPIFTSAQLSQSQSKLHESDPGFEFKLKSEQIRLLSGDLINIGTPTGFVDIIKKEFTGLYNMLGITVPRLPPNISISSGKFLISKDLIDDILKIPKFNYRELPTEENSKTAFELQCIPKNHLGNVSGEAGQLDIV
ncbi:hypothetical protein FQA39_LY18586 [Lamprigera yunnana]|nr:hypothetical protein FQA39_LY18586 [Lamprigera yunnana]